MANHTPDSGTDPRSTRRSKKIVLLSDGAGNSSAKLLKTNIWRICDSLGVRRRAHAPRELGVSRTPARLHPVDAITFVGRAAVGIRLGSYYENNDGSADVTVTRLSGNAVR
jgi:hypothetical protein